MSAALAVFRRELSAHFGSLVAPVVTLLFVLALDGLFFFVGYSVGEVRLPSFWEGRTATLRTMFFWLPLLFVVLVPALTMGAWAEERRSGTEELLLTQPIRPWQAVLGKFLGAWLLLCVVVAAAVVPAAILASWLGDLDGSTALGGLVGAWCLGGACVALGLWVSSLAGDQLIAFLLGVVLLGALWGVGRLARILPVGLADQLDLLDPASHYLESAALGVFDARDLVYFGGLALLGLALNTLAVEGRRWRGGGRA